MKRFGVVLVLLFASSAWATNGMNLGAYGPVAGGLGGASMAYDNGLMGSMNNPATLGLMPEGNHFEVGAALLMPAVTADMTSMTQAKSSATSFPMPNLGFVQRKGALGYGLVFAVQGGMGAEYAADSFLAMGSNEAVRSELAVMRFMAPISYNVTPDFTVGATVDYVRGGLDLKMAVSPQQFGNMMGAKTIGQTSGTLVDALAPGMGGLQWARFDFSNSSSMSQEASGGGFGGKLGATYKVMPNLTVGATYHLKTMMGDFTTAKGSLKADAGMVMTIPGTIKVVDFQWPATFAFGMSYKPMDKLLLVADYKNIGWAATMKSFKMNLVVDASDATYGGKVMDAEFYQNWENQNVFQLGAAYQLLDALTVRVGANIANNPVPDAFVNPLFPAIAKNQYDFGLGYALAKDMRLDFALNIAPAVTVSTPQLGTPGDLVTKMGETTAQLGYGMTF